MPTTNYKGRIDYKISIDDTILWTDFYSPDDYYSFIKLPSKFLRSGVKLPVKIMPDDYDTLQLEYYDSNNNLVSVIDNVQNIYDILVNTIFTELIFTESMYGDMVFYCDVPDRDLITLYVNKMVYPDENTIMLYLLNSPRNQVTKNLILVGGITGNFPRAISKRNIMLDIQNIDSLGDFNYVWVSLLNRYYYVKDLSFIKDFATLNLMEDVLMSFDLLIRSQTAYVERNQNNYDNYKVDSLVTYDYEKLITDTNVTLIYDVYGTNTTPTVTGYYALKVVG